MFYNFLRLDFTNACNKLDRLFLVGSSALSIVYV